MSDSSNSDTANDIVRPEELALLKDRARMMNITFSNNITVQTLRAKIAAVQAAAEATAPDSEGAPEAEVQANALESETPRFKSLREKLMSEQMKLIRLRITNLDPKKKDLPGEIFTVANEYIGTVRKMVPFGEVTDEGFHVPWCIYQMMKDRKFLHVSVKKRGNGQEKVETRWAQEFAFDILPPLTPKEREDLGKAQLAAGIFSDGQANETL